MKACPCSLALLALILLAGCESLPTPPAQTLAPTFTSAPTLEPVATLRPRSVGVVTSQPVLAEVGGHTPPPAQAASTPTLVAGPASEGPAVAPGAAEAGEPSPTARVLPTVTPRRGSPPTPTLIPTPTPLPPTVPPPTRAPTRVPPTPTARPAAPTPDQAAIAAEQSALAVHPGYQKYSNDFYNISFNMPADWKVLGGARLGAQFGPPDRRDRIILSLGIFSPGDLDKMMKERLDLTPNDQVRSIVTSAIGHNDARELVIEAGGKKHYIAWIATSGWTYQLELEGVADESPDIEFAAIKVSFRSPAACGSTVCPDLLARDSATKP